MRIAPLPYADDEERRRLLARNGGGMPPALPPPVDPDGDADPSAESAPEDLAEAPALQPRPAPMAGPALQRPAPIMAGRPTPAGPAAYKPTFGDYLAGALSGLTGIDNGVSGGERRFNAQQAAQRAEQERADQMAQQDAATQNQYASQQYSDAQSLEQQAYQRGRDLKQDAWNQGAPGRAKSAADEMFNQTNAENDRRAQRDFEFKQALAQRGGRGGGGGVMSKEALKIAAEDRAEQRRIEAENRAEARKNGTDTAKRAQLNEYADQWQQANPDFEVIPGAEDVFDEAKNGRGKVAFNRDTAQAAILKSAARKLEELRARYENTPITDLSKINELRSAYDIATAKAVGAFSALSGENNQAASDRARSHIPSLFSPMSESGLAGMDEVVQEVIDKKMGIYGLRGRSGASAPSDGGGRINGAPRAEGLGGSPSGVKIRDPKTGRTGRFQGTAEEARAAGYEVAR